LRGFEITVLADAVAAANDVATHRALAAMHAEGATIVPALGAAPIDVRLAG
jgi:hypothetical protein